MWLAEIFGIDQDVIQIYYNKDIKLFSKDPVNIALKTSQYIKKTKKHDLVLEIAVSGVKGCFSLIIFLDSHLMIGISKSQLSKLLNLA